MTVGQLTRNSSPIGDFQSSQYHEIQRTHSYYSDRATFSHPFLTRPHKISKLREIKNNPPIDKINPKKKKKSKSRQCIYPKRNWSPEEDALLKTLVDVKSEKFNWSEIAGNFDQRIGKQCRERWHNHLNASLIRTEWTIEEDTLLQTLHRQHGNKWSLLKGFFAGRTDNMIKNHWNTSLSKKPKLFSTKLTNEKEDLNESIPTAITLDATFDKSNEITENGNSFSLPVLKVTSLEEIKSDIIRISKSKFIQFPKINQPYFFIECGSPNRMEFTYSGPDFTFRIPVFNRMITDWEFQLPVIPKNYGSFSFWKNNLY